jgi:hypothetical protein
MAVGTLRRQERTGRAVDGSLELVQRRLGVIVDGRMRGVRPCLDRY